MGEKRAKARYCQEKKCVSRFVCKLAFLQQQGNGNNAFTSKQGDVQLGRGNDGYLESDAKL
jgi:hypothetical protein